MRLTAIFMLAVAMLVLFLMPMQADAFGVRVAVVRPQVVVASPVVVRNRVFVAAPRVRAVAVTPSRVIVNRSLGVSGFGVNTLNGCGNVSGFGVYGAGVNAFGAFGY